jgi:integrase
MAKWKMEINNKTVEEFKAMVDDLNKVPLSTFNAIIDKLSKGLDKEKIKHILKGHDVRKVFKDDELYQFFSNLYEFTKKEIFNPEKMKKQVDGDDDKGQTKISQGTKPVIEFNPNLYFDFDFKNEFANTYRESTARVVRALFRKTASIENKYGKDLYEFNIKEMSEVLYALKAKTIRSLQNSISTIEKYLEYAYNEGRLKYEKSLGNAFDSHEKIEKFIDDDAENMIFDKEEIMAMAEDAENAQDGVILALLFDGVSHKNEFEELINLTKKDINFETKEINLPNRTIPMSQETTFLVKDALLIDTYYSINGERVRRYKITEGDYVLRGLRKKLQVKASIISERIIRLAEKFGYKNQLNATTISYSGQVHYAKEMLKKGYSMDEVVDSILTRFNIPINNSSQFYLRTRIEKALEE